MQQFGELFQLTLFSNFAGAECLKQMFAVEIVKTNPEMRVMMCFFIT